VPNVWQQSLQYWVIKIELSLSLTVIDNNVVDKTIVWTAKLLLPSLFKLKPTQLHTQIGLSATKAAYESCEISFILTSPFLAKGRKYIIFQYWKWPAQGTNTVPIVSAHFRSLYRDCRIQCRAISGIWTDLKLYVLFRFKRFFSQYEKREYLCFFRALHTFSRTPVSELRWKWVANNTPMH